MARVKGGDASVGQMAAGTKVNSKTTNSLALARKSTLITHSKSVSGTIMNFAASAKNRDPMDTCMKATSKQVIDTAWVDLGSRVVLTPTV